MHFKFQSVASLQCILFYTPLFSLILFPSTLTFKNPHFKEVKCWFLFHNLGRVGGGGGSVAAFKLGIHKPVNTIPG